MAKALGSSHSPLIRKRTGVKTEPCATVARRPSSDPELSAGDGDASEVAGTNGGLNTEVGATTHGGRDSAETKDSGEKTAVKDSEEEQDRSRAAVTSLVADYSDSDSEPGQ